MSQDAGSISTTPIRPRKNHFARFWVFWPFYTVGLGWLLVLGNFNGGLAYLGWLILLWVGLSLLSEGITSFQRWTIRREWWPFWAVLKSLGLTLGVFSWAFFGAFMAANYQTNSGKYSESIMSLMIFAFFWLQDFWAKGAEQTRRKAASPAKNDENQLRNGRESGD